MDSNGVDIMMYGWEEGVFKEYQSEDSIDACMDELIASIECGRQAAEYDAIFARNTVQLRNGIGTIT